MREHLESVRSCGIKVIQIASHLERKEDVEGSMSFKNIFTRYF